MRIDRCAPARAGVLLIWVVIMSAATADGQPAADRFTVALPKYVQAWFDRLAWYQHARAFFEKYDVLLSPTCANPPLRIGEWFATEIAGGRVGRDAGSAFTVPFPHRPAGGRGPVRLHGAGRPISVQVVGRRFADATVLRVSAALEEAYPWADRRPPEP